MTTSAARMTANAANALHSTGPSTPEGKAHSSQNARKHGLTAREVVIAPEEREEFEELLAGYQTNVQPQGALQQTLFNELVSAAWNLRRVARLEAELCSGASYQDLLANDDLQKKLDRLARHKTRIERTFHRSLKELKSLQTEITLKVTASGGMWRAMSPLSSAIEIAKRTQPSHPRPLHGPLNPGNARIPGRDSVTL